MNVTFSKKRKNPSPQEVNYKKQSMFFLFAQVLVFHTNNYILGYHYSDIKNINLFTILVNHTMLKEL